jgi:pimeloyl-ACP methyl ester carboxylesterase
VFLTGIGGSIEQMVHVQAQIARSTQTLAYDRGGYGFSSGSSAFTSAEQAAELLDLLDALKIKGRVVLVGFSSASAIARLFLARYPERTQGLYFVEPYLPEVALRIPGSKSRRRTFVRWIVHDLFMSTFGLLRARNRLANFAGPPDPVEQRAEEILQSRHHFWAMAREWYAIPETNAEAMAARVNDAPIVIFFTEQPNDTMSEQVFGEFVRRSPRGKLVRLPNHEHSKLLTPGPVLDVIAQGIVEMATSPAP